MIKQILLTLAVLSLIFVMIVVIEGFKTETIDETVKAIKVTELPAHLQTKIINGFWQNTEYEKQYKRFFEDMEEEGFAEIELVFIFSDDRIEFIEGPKDTTYDDSLFSEKSIQKGKDILVEHDSLLQAVEDKYGVPKEIQISIMKTESDVGEFIGLYKVFNVFHTKWLRARRYKSRKYARNELKCFLIICKENNWGPELYNTGPLSIYGSCAGAFGWAQFIPSSYRRWAVDGNGDGKVDLFNLADALHSIGNYLKEFGWRKNRWNWRNKRAIYGYNHSWRYVRTVHKYATKIGFGSSFK